MGLIFLLLYGQVLNLSHDNAIPHLIAYKESLNV